MQIGKEDAKQKGDKQSQIPDKYCSARWYSPPHCNCNCRHKKKLGKKPNAEHRRYSARPIDMILCHWIGYSSELGWAYSLSCAATGEYASGGHREYYPSANCTNGNARDQPSPPCQVCALE